VTLNNRKFRRSRLRGDEEKFSHGRGPQSVKRQVTPLLFPYSLWVLD